MISTLDTMGIGGGWTLAFCFFFLIVPDLYFLMISLQQLLMVTWKGTVAPSMVKVLYSAERMAIKYGSTTIDKNHLVAALLMDEDSRQLLEYGETDLRQMDEDSRQLLEY